MVEFTYLMYTSIQNGFMLRIPAKHTHGVYGYKFLPIKNCMLKFTVKTEMM